MKIGQTSIVVFVSKVVGSALGFVATLYFARVLGAEVLGIYALIMTVVSWLVLFGRLGIGGAMIKRISEGEQQSEYYGATVIWLTSIWIVGTVIVLLAHAPLDNYVTEFDEYVAMSVAWFIAAIVFVNYFQKTMVFSTLVGLQKVHIRGLLEPVSIGTRVVLQVTLVLLGHGLLGMLWGFIASSILVGLIGLYWVDIRPSIPTREHFRSLFEYAKFSWLGGLKSRAFNNVDILLLGLFVPSALVGVYSISWSIAKFIELFGQAIHSTVFPEISHKSAQESRQAVAGMVEKTLAFNGLVAIPGLVGGVILGTKLLRLYGDEFTRGTSVLALLILATLVYSYQSQLTNALNGIDRPDLAFHINAVFISTNAVLNVVLIWRFGLEGAAIATVISAGIGLVLSYYVLRRLIDFSVPVQEPLRQIAAALLMGGLIRAGLAGFEATDLVSHNAFIVLTMVGLGATVYFLTLFGISAEFRVTVDRNLPIDVPFAG